jgi:hypothetical protein
MMNQAFAPKIGKIYTEGDPDFAAICDLIGSSQEVLAKILDVSESTLRNKRVSSATLRKTGLLIHILNMLWEISGGDEKQIRRFMHEPRIEWLGLTPISLLSCGKGTEVAKLLEGMIDGDPIS